MAARSHDDALQVYFLFRAGSGAGDQGVGKEKKELHITAHKYNQSLHLDLFQNPIHPPGRIFWGPEKHAY